MSQTPIVEPQISFHDSSQIEVKMVHHIPAEVETGKTVLFTQQVYLYIPNSLGVNASTYPNDLFYRSLTNYIRVKTPQFIDEEERENCRIDRLMPTLFQTQVTGESVHNFEVAINEVRVFGAYLNDQFKHWNAPTMEQLRLQVNEIQALMIAFRGIMDDVLQKCAEVPEAGELRIAFRYIDEFVSNRFEETLASFVIQGLDLRDSIAMEYKRREQMGYLQVFYADGGENKIETSKEAFSYRMGKLKKYASELLYFEVKRYRFDQIWGHIIAGVAAAFVAVNNAILDPTSKLNLVDSLYGHLAGSLMVGLTIVAILYVFKDRAKAVLRDFLFEKVKPWIPDYSFKVKYPGVGVIGSCREEVKFIKPSEVPDSVLRVRLVRSEHIPFIDASEAILKYTRHFRIRKKSLTKVFSNLDSVKDILRFDFNPFLTKLGNPSRPERFVLPDGEVKHLHVPKVYHVNLVVCYQIFLPGVKLPTFYYSRARIILDKNGIKRVEVIDASAVETNYIKPSFLNRSLNVLTDINPF